MKKFISITVALTMVLITVFSTFTASADDFDYTTMDKINTWYEGYLDDYNTVDFYKIVVKSDSKLTIKLMHFMSTAYYFYNSDLSSAITNNSWEYGGNSNSPETSTFEYVLTKGTYYIKLEKLDAGKYKINYTLKSFGNNEKEPDSYENPMLLSEGQKVTGALTIQDEADWFKIEVPTNCSVSINLSHYMSTAIYLYNSDLSQALIDNSWEYGGNENSPQTSKFDKVLTKGVYYIKVLRLDCGKYQLWWNMDIKVGKPNDFKASSVSTSSIKLSWKSVSGASGYQLQMMKNGSWSNVVNTTSTSFKSTNLKSATEYKYRIRAYKTISKKKYYGAWRELATCTKPVSVSISSLKSGKSKQITVKWKKIACSGYQIQYSTNSKFSNAKSVSVSGSGTTSKKISGLKGKKKYYVRVRAYKSVNGNKTYGTWSKTKSVTTKK